MYTISPAHDDAFYARIVSDISICRHIDRVYLKDPAGILTPDRARTVFRRFARLWAERRRVDWRTAGTLSPSPSTQASVIRTPTTTFRPSAAPTFGCGGSTSCSSWCPCPDETGGSLGLEWFKRIFY
jgi:hypothetical protein